MTPYCFAANSPLRFIDFDGLGPKDRIKAAQTYLKTKYKQQSEGKDKLRTSNSEEALKYMDCSELVCRVLVADELLAANKPLVTASMIPFFEGNDNWQTVATPSAGDVILWNGHTALVESYDAETKKVKVIHATKYQNKNGTSVESVVEEEYKMSYYEKKGAKFWRPINDTPDGPETDGKIVSAIKTASNAIANDIPKATFGGIKKFFGFLKSISEAAKK